MNKIDTARIVTTWDCNRNCPGCCNETLHRPDSCSSDRFREFDKFVITGGEPMLYPDGLYRLLMSQIPIDRPKYLQTAFIDTDKIEHREIIELINGINYTIHHPATPRDIAMLKRLSQYLSLKPELNLSSRLIIDEREWDNVMNDKELQDILANSLTQPWLKIVRLEWKDNCPLPQNEELLYYDIVATAEPCSKTYKKPT